MILNVKGKAQSFDFNPKTLIIAGFTGKDSASAKKHLEELRELGVPVPEKIPAFYPVDPSMVTDAQVIEVHTKESSGEAEPVLITSGGKMYIAVGSDHTARDLEMKDIGESKKACVKPVSSDVFELEYVLKNWESLLLRSYVRKDGERILYQDGKASELLPVHDLLEKLREWKGNSNLEESIIFLGTVPLLTGKFVYGDWYRVELIEEKSGTSLSREYTVKS